MKKIFTLSFILMSVYAWSQKAAITKVFAWSQETTAGARPQVQIDENGKETGKTIEVKENYFIYAEQIKSTQVSFYNVWINGKAYKLKADKVAAPVEMMEGEADEKEKVVLAPATKNNMWSITQGTLINTPAKPSFTLQNLIDKNELVLVYRWKGKLYYSAVKNIKKLKAAVGV